MSNNYSERQRIEKQYHDDKYRHAGVPETVARITTPHSRLSEMIGQPRNLTILDFGCGSGWLAVMLAKEGNTVCGFDISEVLIEQAKALAQRSGVSDRTSFHEMAAEQLDFPDDTFDMIIGSSILHHTDLDITLRRIQKTLKPEGTAIFLEPLNQNLVLKIWRLLTPWRRSETERALTGENLSTIRALFPAARFHYYCLTSTFTEGLLLFRPRSKFVQAMNGWLEYLDERILRGLPWLGRFSAVVIMEMRK